MLQLITEHNFTSVYPYAGVALRIFLCTPSTNCSAERSFSTLKRIKNYFRSTIAQDRCLALAVLTIEDEITTLLDFEKIINDFASSESRKKNI
jgi:hypothetical protein